jgi:hypothetical protein
MLSLSYKGYRVIKIGAPWRRIYFEPQGDWSRMIASFLIGAIRPATGTRPPPAQPRQCIVHDSSAPPPDLRTVLLVKAAAAGIHGRAQRCIRTHPIVATPSKSKSGL